MIVIKSLRWGGLCILDTRIRLLRHFQPNDVAAATQRNSAVAKTGFARRSVAQEQPQTGFRRSRGDESLSDEVLMLRRHLHLLRKYRNETSLKLVFDVLRDRPYNSRTDIQTLEEFLAALETLDIPDTPENLMNLVEIHSWLVERGIAVGSKRLLAARLAEMVVRRMPNHGGLREYNRVVARFLESLESDSADFIVRCLASSLPALREHLQSILMTEQARIVTAALGCRDLPADVQQFLLDTLRHLEAYSDLFDFNEMHYFLDSLELLSSAGLLPDLSQQVEASLRRNIANLDRRLSREILGPVHNPVAFSRSLALVTAIGATDVQMQILRDRLERVVLPRTSLVKYMLENSQDQRHASRLQRTWLLRLIQRQAKLHDFDIEVNSNTRARENKRKTEQDVRSFCDHLLGNYGVPHLMCPVKIMNVVRWKSQNLKQDVLLSQDQASQLETLLRYYMSQFTAQDRAHSSDVLQAAYLKNHLDLWKSGSTEATIADSPGVSSTKSESQQQRTSPFNLTFTTLSFDEHKPNSLQ